MSSGRMSPDLSDMWHQGPPMSPQWEGGLEIDLDSTSEGGTDQDWAADATTLMVPLRKAQKTTSVTYVRVH